MSFTELAIMVARLERQLWTALSQLGLDGFLALGTDISAVDRSRFRS
jgi:hypothetical protein